jgi:hypothetical protein
MSAATFSIAYRRYLERSAPGPAEQSEPVPDDHGLEPIRDDEGRRLCEHRDAEELRRAVKADFDGDVMKRVTGRGMV